MGAVGITLRQHVRHPLGRRVVQIRIVVDHMNLSPDELPVNAPRVFG